MRLISYVKRRVQILRGEHSGEVGTVTGFSKSNSSGKAILKVELDTGEVIHVSPEDVKVLLKAYADDSEKLHRFVVMDAEKPMGGMEYNFAQAYGRAAYGGEIIIASSPSEAVLKYMEKHGIDGDIVRCRGDLARFKVSRLIEANGRLRGVGYTMGFQLKHERKVQRA